MKHLLLLCISLILSAGVVPGQTFNGSGGVIPDDGNVQYYSQLISSLPQQMMNDAFGLKSVTIKLNHPYDAELEIKLVSPAGNTILLSRSNGGSGDNYLTTTFTDFATKSITEGSAPFNGEYRPQEALSALNNGQDGTGIWKLHIRDLQSGNGRSGYLSTWSLTYGYNPNSTSSFTSSNLPIVLIDTHEQTIVDDPKIPVDMTILYNGPGIRNFITDTANFFGRVGIEIRGSSSQSFPKKSYGIENWDLNNLSIDTTLLGMPSESDWILNANYTDKTLCRNVMTYQAFTNMSHYGTRYRFVELMINNEYLGIYILSEKIKRDKNRVDISKLTPDENTGDNLTGGYIVKIDKWTGSGGDGWTSPYPPPVHPNGQTIYFQYEYPKYDEISGPQKNYIKNYITTWESVLNGPNFADTINGYRKYSEESSFIDYFLVNEISKNVDGYRLSTYLHKQRDSKGGKIRMGPVWDYDIAWHNADYCMGYAATGWAYQFPCSGDTWQIPFWWGRLLEDPLYTSRLKCRWLHLRSTSLSNDFLNTYIDSLATQLDEAQARNFTTWPILGVYVWPNPWPFPTSYAGEISSLKSWIASRMEWLDANMPGTCYTIGMDDLAGASPEIETYPNPVCTSLNVQSQLPQKGKYMLELFNPGGRKMLSVDGGLRDRGVYLDQMNMESLSPGIYLLRITINGAVMNRKVVKL